MHSKLLASYNISESQKENFLSKGHVFLPGIADSSIIDHCRSKIVDCTFGRNKEQLPLEDRDTYGKAFLQTMNLWKTCAAVKEFVFAPLFSNIAAELLEVPKVRLYHDQSLFKEAGGGYTPWHQDQYYWPLEPANTITMWMPLVDITSSMGTLSFASGSHSEGIISNESISDNSENHFENEIRDKSYQISHLEKMKAGDATFHHGLTIHGAGPNNSSVLREVMTIIYFADGLKVSQPANSHQEDDRMAWLGGIEPGKLADSAYNPILN